MKGRVDLLSTYHTGSSGYYILFEGSESDPNVWNLLTEDPRTVKELENSALTLQKIFVQAIPEFTYFLFKLDTIRKELGSRVKRVTYDSPGLQVVSLSRVYYSNGWSSVDVNRMIDIYNKLLGEAGPRTGSAPLKIQVGRIQSKAGNKSVVIVDDVCFKGQTSKTLISLGLRVADIIGGVVTDKATATLTKRRLISKTPDGNIGSVSYQQPIRIHPIITVGQDNDAHGQFIDTCPLHDFLPLAPFCGLTIGTQTTSFGPIPLTRGGVSFTRPYLLPYLDVSLLQAKASIPPDKAIEFSVLALENAIRLFEGLNEILGYSLTPKKLSHLIPNCSYPLPQTENIWEVDLEEPITKILRRHLTLIEGGDSDPGN